MADEAERHARWEKAGSPLFSRLWTYDEIQKKTRDPSFNKTGGLPNAHLKTPKGWPSDTKIDPGRWVFWLPEGWKQAKRTQEDSGKVLTCFFNEENKRFWHKRAVEKFLGYELEEKPPKEEKAEEDEATKKKYVTDDDVFPYWPSGSGVSGDWLPRDWRIGFRQKPGGLHKIYVPPEQEAGFCYQKADVAEYLATGKKLTLFGISMFAEERWGHGMTKKRKKSRKHARAGRHYKFAKADDYLEVKTFRVLKLPLSEEEEKTGMEALADLQEIQEQLREHGFEDPKLLLTTLTNPKQSKEPVPSQKIVERMCSLWYCRPDDFCEKQCYQRVFLKEQIGSKKDLICCDTHIFWSPQYDCWKIGHLNEDMAGYLRCDDPVQFPWETKKNWRVVESHLCVP